MRKAFKAPLTLSLILFLCLAPAIEGDAKTLKVALLLEHDGDSPFNALLKAGLERAGRELGALCSTIIAPRGGEQVEIFRRVASESDLVIVATDNLHEILRDNAGAFRSTKFGSIDAGIRARNIMSVTFADEQAAFLAGVASALAAPKAPLAWLSGEDVPALRSLYNGYVEGAKLADPDRQVAQAVSGSFVDPRAAAEKAESLRERSPAVVVLASGLGNAAARRVLGEILTVAMDGKIEAPNTLGSIVKALDRAVFEIVDSAASGAFAAKEIRVYDLANGGVDFILSKDASKKFVDAARRVRELKEEFAKGALRLPSLRQRTLCDCLD